MNSFDVVIYGATPGGIGAALGAARQGRKTLLLEPTDHLGGMLTSGLGRTDILSREACGAVFREFADRVHAYYRERYGDDSEQVRDCNKGLFFEPSVAMRILLEMTGKENSLTIRMRAELKETRLKGRRLTGIRVQTVAGEWEIEGSAFIDGTYEGDLAKMAGVPYRLGREPRDVWNEEYAGKLYMNFDEPKEVYPGSTGEGDERIQAYNFRLCLTRNPDNFIEIARPPIYDRESYASLAADVADGRVKSIRDVLNMLSVPNGKTDCNNHHFCLCSTDLPEENTAYPDGDRETRERFVERQKHYIQGLLWFVQHDEELPEAFRKDALSYGYAADEFIEYDYFPPQLYVREARRIWGEYTFTENDARLAPGLERAPIQFDSIAIGDYPIDSHAVKKREPQGRNKALEGFLGLNWLAEAYQIPYGVIVPQAIDGLLVPVAVSATHMGFGTIRMEPCWMQLGFAAGIAADLAIALGADLRHVPIDVLQTALLDGEQRITYFEDVAWDHPARQAAEYFGTRGFFSSYTAGLDDPMPLSEAAKLIAWMRTLPGCRALPVLPATDRLLPVGIDMGPRLPMNETSPGDYWREHRVLTGTMAARWIGVASGALGISDSAGEWVDRGISKESRITRGAFMRCLYKLIREVQAGHK
ncbi:FAD dependent oxidoreductase [Cohnella sp. OV330]|uniref:FAD-dependent oxidoreductase n=1 Tax=Cohnella sp. OV330 TaxID=1855288 RepID=UPI0008EA6924|nr:FAD-dependent oxidoreductase [Cohnella sp. OV330]SFB58053.1 FAD dependent oxidoreductase [Cohnella sp. OV330]